MVRRRYNEVGAPDNRINVVVSQVLTPRTKTSNPVLDSVVTAHHNHNIISVCLIKSFFGKGAVAVLVAALFVYEPLILMEVNHESRTIGKAVWHRSNQAA